MSGTAVFCTELILYTCKILHVHTVRTASCPICMITCSAADNTVSSKQLSPISIVPAAVCSRIITCSKSSPIGRHYICTVTITLEPALNSFLRCWISGSNIFSATAFISGLFCPPCPIVTFKINVSIMISIGHIFCISS